MAHEDEGLYAVVSISSDNLELNDYDCMPCNQHFINNKAFYFCATCRKQYCHDCNDKHSYLFKEHDHAVRGEEDKNDWVTWEPEENGKRSNCLNDLKEQTDDVEESSNLRVRNKRTCNIKVDTDRKLSSCNVTGCCYLPDARTVLADSTNRCLKLLSEDKYIMALHDLPEDPHEVCYIDGNEIAVTLAGNMVMIYQISSLSIEEKNVLALDHECQGIAYSNSQLYIADFQRIYVYTIEGKQTSVLYSNMSMGKRSVKSFAISKDGSKLYVANYDNSVLRTIDIHGKTLATLEDPDLRNPSGVCVGDDGNVFVCGMKSNTIVQVNADGTRKLGVITRADGLSSPSSLCFDGINSSLVVCQQKNSAILVLALKVSGT